MPSAGFEHSIPVIERVQTYALDGRATQIRWSILIPSSWFLLYCPEKGGKCLHRILICMRCHISEDGNFQHRRENIKSSSHFLLYEAIQYLDPAVNVSRHFQTTFFFLHFRLCTLVLPVEHSNIVAIMSRHLSYSVYKQTLSTSQVMWGRD